MRKILHILILLVVLLYASFVLYAAYFLFQNGKTIGEIIKSLPGIMLRAVTTLFDALLNILNPVNFIKILFLTFQLPFRLLSSGMEGFRESQTEMINIYLGVKAVPGNTNNLGPDFSSTLP